MMYKGKWNFLSANFVTCQKLSLPKWGEWGVTVSTKFQEPRKQWC